MEKDTIKNNMESIGKSAFIKYFDILRNNNLTNKEKIRILIEEYKDDEVSARLRVSFSEKIFNKKDNIVNALEIVINAKRVKLQYRSKAKELLLTYLDVLN